MFKKSNYYITTNDILYKWQDEFFWQLFHPFLSILANS